MEQALPRYDGDDWREVAAQRLVMLRQLVRYIERGDTSPSPPRPPEEWEALRQKHQAEIAKLETALRSGQRP